MGNDGSSSISINNNNNHNNSSNSNSASNSNSSNTRCSSNGSGNGADAINSADMSPMKVVSDNDTANGVAVDPNTDVEEGFQAPRTTRQSSLRETTERLEDAVVKAMTDYQRARKEVLFGLDDLGRPPEEVGAAVTAGRDQGDGQGANR